MFSEIRKYGIRMRINSFEHWMIKNIISKMVRQDYHHSDRISYLYEMIYDACRREFYEDNTPTLEAFLQECFDDAKPVPEAEQTKSDIENAEGMQQEYEEWLKILKNRPKWKKKGC
jgi:hypothetical protein